MKPVPISSEICILAGGLSSRMGRDKTQLRWRGKSLLLHVKEAARKSAIRGGSAESAQDKSCTTGRVLPPYPVRVIRRDLVKRCGPLGGVYTALKTTRFDVVLFLACDMPFVSDDLIGRFLELKEPAFTYGPEGAGFPFLLPRSAYAVVERQIALQRYSIQLLAKKLSARKIRPRDMIEVFNVNTPEDWRVARKIQTAKATLVIPPKNSKVVRC